MLCCAFTFFLYVKRNIFNNNYLIISDLCHKKRRKPVVSAWSNSVKAFDRLLSVLWQKKVLRSFLKEDMDSEL